MVPREKPFPSEWHATLPVKHRILLENLMELVHSHPRLRETIKDQIPRTIFHVKNRGDLERLVKAAHQHIDGLGPEVSGMRKDLVRVEAYVRRMQRSDFAPPRGKPQRHRG